MTSIYQIISELEKNDESVVLCTIVKSQGSTPRRVGSKMLVYPNGKSVGSIGGGDLEHRVLDEAWIAFSEGKPRTLTYHLVNPKRGDPGVCGGTIEVFVEPILSTPTVVIIGAGHVGKAIVHLAKWLGFRVVVSDDRGEFCNPESAPGADAYYPLPMEELASQLKITRRTFLAITSRGSALDALGLPSLLTSQAAYIGVIGSKRRWLTTVKALKAKGVPEELIARVHSPMGIELNAETPEEIAVSVMAEILMIRDKGTGKSMKD
ncbi:MAG: XdhC/CoxI family protein [Anaerolineaceae bacterium]|nr:XdhC/CoxI family protein [Anaerolineaceae bacterium]